MLCPRCGLREVESSEIWVELGIPIFCVECSHSIAEEEKQREYIRSQPNIGKVDGAL